MNIVNTFDSFLKWEGKSWIPPIYKKIRKLPFIPTETELDQLIAACSRKMLTFLQMLKETGMRSGEACQLKWIDIDLVNNFVSITPEKGGNPRKLPLSNKLVSMLNEIPKENTKPFPNSTEVWRRNFSKQRKRIAFKLKNPRIKKITFHTFRHWKGTMEFYKTKDLTHVKRILGHKSILNTEKYIHLVCFKEDEFIAKVAHTEKDACELIESGFEHVCDFNENKLFRKRK